MAVDNDLFYIKQALRLAEKGRVGTSPNPMVGCVVVNGGRVVGQGWHEFFGGPHAEANALRRAGKKARGGTLYVNLEPCSHWGKTAPCAEAVARAGVRRAVVAMTDPNPKVKGRGLRHLRRAGLRVTVGPLEKEAKFLNRAFVKLHTRRLPYVIYKAAQTLDGKIAAWTGRSRWITGPAARAHGHRLRAECDAILVGGNTVRRDNPSLTSHGRGPNPLRLILSASLNLPVNARVFNTESPAIVLTEKSPRAERFARRAGAHVLTFSNRRGGLDLKEVFRRLTELGIGKVLIEGGGQTGFAALAAKLVDEVYLFLAPRFSGARGAPTSAEGRGWPSPQAAPGLFDIDISDVGGDFLLHGFVR